MRDAERRAALEVIAAEVRACTRCPLHATRTRAVPGEGDPSTEVVFVGEGPGQNEDHEGRPDWINRQICNLPALKRRKRQAAAKNLKVDPR